MTPPHLAAAGSGPASGAPPAVPDPDPAPGGGSDSWADPGSRRNRVWSLLSLLLPLMLVIQPAASLPEVSPTGPAAAGLAAVSVLYVALVASILDLLPGRAGAAAYRPRLAGLWLLLALGAALVLSYGAGPGGWILTMIYPAAAGASVLATPRAALGWVAGTTAATGVLAAYLGERQAAMSLEILLVTLIVGLIGLAVYNGRRTYEAMWRLHQTRAELAAAVVVAERLRFSRDLHDLLGHTLSLIVVKAEVARRSAGQDPPDPAAAAREAGQIEQIGRRALAEVRQAVAGYRQQPLATEVEAARSALADAGIRVTVRVPDTPLPTRVDGLLGWVVREAVTNVIRHSGAGRCRVHVSLDSAYATVEVADDGTGTGTGGGGTGRGLTGLAERLHEAGGQLTAGRAETGWRLVASVPVTEPDAYPDLAGVHDGDRAEPAPAADQQPAREPPAEPLDGRGRA